MVRSLGEATAGRDNLQPRLAPKCRTPLRFRDFPATLDPPSAGPNDTRAHRPSVTSLRHPGHPRRPDAGPGRRRRHAPIYQTSTYVQDGLGQHKGYEYARTQNPTREALERNVAALEGGSHGFAFGSGLAALDTILKLFKAGDHVVCGRQRVRRHPPAVATGLRQTSGSSSPSSTCATSAASRGALTPATRLVYCETPTNPMMRLTDLAARRRPRAGRAASCSRWTTPSRRRSSSGRSSWAPTSCSTPPPST